MMNAIRFASCCLVLAFAAPAQAGLIFDFGNPPSNASVGSSTYSVTLSGKTLTVSGFNANNTSHTLNWKTQGSDEHGIGFVGTSDNELTLSNINAIANWMQIDVASVYLDGAFSSGQIRVQSNTSGESFDVFGTNTAGTLSGALKLINGNALDSVFVALPNWGTYRYYDLAVHIPGHSSSDNILMDAIQVIPEPATLSLVGLGALGVVIRRRRMG